MAYISATEQFIQKVELGRLLTESKLIKGIITRDRGSVEKKRMVDGNNYYEGEHDVLNKSFNIYYVKGQKKTTNAKANYKIVNAFHTDLVDQKKDFIMSVQPTISHTSEKTQGVINEIIGENLFDFLEDACVGASNQGVEWGHVFINEKGEFDFTIVPAVQLIPDYDNNYKKTLLSMMRYYSVDAQDEKGSLKQVTKVEIWTDKEVHFYIENDKGEFIRDLSETENPRPHWKEFMKQGEEVVSSENKSWGRVPFFPLPNNKKKISDLKRIKTLIDLYDVVLSQFGNQVEDVKEIQVVIRNYDGTDNEQLIQMFKENGLIKVTGDGGAEPLTLTIPVEAKESILKMLKENIYRFGRGIDYSGLALNNPTNLTLKFMYTGLDLKANAMIKGLNRFIKELISFFGIWKATEINTGELTITFTKSMIINEGEIIENIVNSTGLISKRTQLEKHPYVDDVDWELEEIQKETEGLVDLGEETE